MTAGNDPNQLLGVDIGGSGMKARIVDVSTGELVTERVKRTTPALAEPDALATTLASLVADTGWSNHLGVTFPGVITNNVARTANNLEQGWIGVNIVELFERSTGLAVSAINDADAAAIAEATFGAAVDEPGVVVVVTLGTGIGTGLLVDGTLVPNTELGQIRIGGGSAELYCSSAARVRDKLSFETFGLRLNRYLTRLTELVWPDLIIVGGGISRDFDQYCDQLHPPTRVVAAALRNEAGIVGAALAASHERSTIERAGQ